MTFIWMILAVIPPPPTPFTEKKATVILSDTHILLVEKLKQTPPLLKEHADRRSTTSVSIRLLRISNISLLAKANLAYQRKLF